MGIENNALVQFLPFSSKWLKQFHCPFDSECFCIRFKTSRTKKIKWKSIIHLFFIIIIWMVISRTTYSIHTTRGLVTEWMDQQTFHQQIIKVLKKAEKWYPPLEEKHKKNWYYMAQVIYKKNCFNSKIQTTHINLLIV